MNSWSGSSAPPGRQNAGRGRAPLQSRDLPRRRASCPDPSHRQRALRRGERDTPDQTWRAAGQLAGPSPMLARGQRDHAVPEANAANDAAVAAYRLGVNRQAALGMPARPDVRTRLPSLGAARIAEARRVPSSGLTEDPAITVGAQSQ